MEDQLRELIPFLRDRNPQVRQIALSNLLPHTPTDSPHRTIFFSTSKAGGFEKPEGTDVIRDLKLLCRDQLTIAHDAFRALVNLSDSPLLVAPLSEPSFLNFVVSYIINPQSILADLASMLLSNLTASSSACSAVLSLNVSIILDETFPNGYYPTQSRCGTCTAPVPYPSGESRDVLAMPLLLDAFVQGAQVDVTVDVSERLRKADLHFLASVFANLTMSAAGRIFFLTPRSADPVKQDGLEYPLAKLVSFTEHKNIIRRGGVASTVKNCAFHEPGHRAMLSTGTIKLDTSSSTTCVVGIDVLPRLLLPLAGPEEFDFEEQECLPEALQFLPPTKTRESDVVVRLTHVESLLLLCSTRWGREYLRTNGVYEIVRALHEWEVVDKISEHIERLVNLLKRDEPTQDNGLAQGFGGQREAVSEIISDGEDNKIEEV